MAITVATEILDLLEKSQLLKPEQLEQARAAKQDGDDAMDFVRRLVARDLITEWQAGQLIAGVAYFFLGKYKLLKLLGKGGMGKVYLGEHVMMNRRVALKIISGSVSKEPAALERFLTEARAVAALDHPNIVQAYSVDNEGERLYLVMEFVDGQDLEQLVQAEGTLDDNVAADYISQAAEGLQHGHQRNMIHCDIKPANLLLNEKGVVKIVDMGLAQLQEDTDEEKKEEEKKKEQTDGQVIGSVDFLAPEQAMGTDFNHRADIYSLGCTLYFLLTGQPPFPEGMLHEKLMKHQTVDPESITEFRDDVSEILIEACEKMMAKEPDDRYQSAAEICKALAKMPAPKRRAKAAAPLKAPAGMKRAEALPEPDATPGFPGIDTGDSGRIADRLAKPGASKGSGSGIDIGSGVGIGSGVRHGSGVGKGRKSGVGKGRKSGVGKGRKSGVGRGRKPAASGIAALLQTPQQKMIAGAIGGGIVLIGVLLIVLFSMGGGDKKKKKDWLDPGKGTGASSGSGGRQAGTRTPTTKPPTRPRAAPEPLGLEGYGADVNPLGIGFGAWYATEVLPSTFDEKKFPEEGVDLQSKGPNGKPLWHEFSTAFDGMVQDLSGGDNASTYLFRTITVKSPATLPAVFGSDDGLMVWLNGKKIISINRERGAQEHDKTDLKLNAGENELLVKIYNYGRGAAYFFESDFAKAKPRETKPDKTPAKGEPLVFDFESGNLQGWKVINGKFELPVSDRDFQRNKNDQKYNKQGKFYLSTVEKPGDQFDDKMTGTIESPVFIPSSPKMSMLIGGGKHRDTYVALCTLNNKEVQRAQGDATEVMQRVEWDVPQLVGKQVVLRVTDRNKGGFGHVTFDDFRAEGKLDLRATEKRLGKEAVAMATAKHLQPGPEQPKEPTPKDPTPKDPTPKDPVPEVQPPKKPTLNLTDSFAIYNMDEKSGRLYDLSGEKHSGVVRGSVTFGEEGKHGGALRFDGTGGRVIIEGSKEGTDQGFKSSDDFTWTAWIKTNTDGSIIAFTREKENWSRGGKILHLRDNGRLNFEVNGGGNFSGKQIADDKWHHVALVVKAYEGNENGDATLYIDGEKNAEKKNWKVGHLPDKGDFVLKIGFSNKNYRNEWKSFNGLIDNVTIFHRALTPDEIKISAEHLQNPFELLGQNSGLEQFSKSTESTKHVLGKLSLSADSGVNLILIGGRKAVRPPGYFEMEFDDATGKGVIFLHSERQGKPVQAAVAQVYIENDTLGFQWAQKIPANFANALLRCGLDITIDGKTRFLQLGRPQIVKPVTINLETGMSRCSLGADALPERESLRLHLVRLEGPLPKAKFEPGRTLIPTGEAKITFDPEVFPKFWLYVLFNFRGRPTVDVTAMIDYSIENIPASPRPFKGKEANGFLTRLAQEKQLLQQKMIREPNKKGECEKKIKIVEEAGAKFMLLVNDIYMKCKKEPAKLHFRLNMILDEDHEVTLMQSFESKKPTTADADSAPVP